MCLTGGHAAHPYAKVLRRYSDKTVARDLVAELESYSGDPSNIMLSGMLELLIIFTFLICCVRLLQQITRK